MEEPTFRQKVAIYWLARGASAERAAALVGVTTKRVRVWRRNPRFRAGLDREGLHPSPFPDPARELAKSLRREAVERGTTWSDREELDGGK